MSKFTSAKRLSELLSDELKVYKEILELTGEQTAQLTKDEFEAFNDSLDKRETLIGKIKGLHQESDSLMQSYISSSAGGKEKNNEIESLKKQLNEIIRKCADLNDSNIETMNEKTQEHIKKIDDQSSKRKGIGGYAQSVPNMPEVFDKKS